MQVSTVRGRASGLTLSNRRSLRAVPFQVSVCRPVHRCVKSRAETTSADTEVNTQNNFRFTNSISENIFEVKGDINKIFRYAADFSHIDRWDSGTTDSELRQSSERPALKVGDTVALMTVLLGVKSSCVYQLMEKEAPRKVVFFGVSRFHESTDTVTFKPKPGSEDVVQVGYKTQIALTKWYRLFQPILGFLMANLAKEAVEGLQQKLQHLQEQGKFVQEKAAAAK